MLLDKKIHSIYIYKIIKLHGNASKSLGAFWSFRPPETYCRGLFRRAYFHFFFFFERIFLKFEVLLTEFLNIISPKF